MASRIVYTFLKIEDTTDAGLELDTVLDGIGAEVDRRRRAGQVGEAPKTVRVSGQPLRELKGTRKDSDTAMIFSRKATRSRDDDDDD